MPYPSGQSTKHDRDPRRVNHGPCRVVSSPAAPPRVPAGPEFVEPYAVSADPRGLIFQDTLPPCLTVLFWVALHDATKAGQVTGPSRWVISGSTCSLISSACRLAASRRHQINTVGAGLDSPPTECIAWSQICEGCKVFFVVARMKYAEIC